jgi:hypothetical protein
VIPKHLALVGGLKLRLGWLSYYDKTDLVYDRLEDTVPAANLFVGLELKPIVTKKHDFALRVTVETEQATGAELGDYRVRYGSYGLIGALIWIPYWL